MAEEETTIEKTNIVNHVTDELKAQYYAYDYRPVINEKTGEVEKDPETRETIMVQVRRSAGDESAARAEDEASLESRMFWQMVERSVADVSGHINLNNNGHKLDEPPMRVTIASVVDGIRNVFKKDGTDPKNILDYVLGNVSSYSKGIVQTPHPTEVLKRLIVKPDKKTRGCSMAPFLEQASLLLFIKSKVHLNSCKNGKPIPRCCDRLSCMYAGP